jgi:5-methyltetrahydrofolate--homocysteine methyltransferase
MKGLLERARDGEVLVSDGAMGTFLHAKGMGMGDCPESWCISHPEVVKGIAEAYVAAGSQIVETNSFGGSSLKLNSYGLRDKVREFNRAAASLAREAVGDKGYVAASIGPTGHIAQEEGGELALAEFYESFKEQAAALAEGGADAICIETMSSVLEAVQAIRAAKETGLPVVCTFTFELGRRGFRTMMGVSPDHAARDAAAAGSDIIGTNCGNGIGGMIDVVRQMRTAVPQIPILVHANAGVPVVEDGKAVFKETPEYMASRIQELIEAGAGIVGGCCGTGPEHIVAIATAVRALRQG